MAVVEMIAVLAGEWLEEELGLPVGAMATVKWLGRTFMECDNCDCTDWDCDFIEVDDDIVGCECCAHP